MQLTLANQHSPPGSFVGYLDLIESLLVIEEKLVDMPRGDTVSQLGLLSFSLGSEDLGVPTDSCAPRSRGSPPGTPSSSS